MYGYSDFTPCRKEEVLRRISQEEIYKLVIDELPPVNKYVVSPFRSDRKAGAYYMWFNGILYFKDFGDPIRQMRDCFQAVMDLMHLTFKETLLLVNDHFKLGLNTGNPVPIIYQDVIINNKINKSITGKIIRVGDVRPSNEIVYKPRGFFPIDKNYWYDRYEISRRELIEDDVFPTVWYEFYSRKGQLVTIRPQDITYCYAGFDDGRCKVYRPLISGVGKWLTNCNENDVGGIKGLPKFGDKLYIMKAFKDYRIIKNEKLFTIWFQNEGMFPQESILLDLCYRFKEIIVVFDNDEKGIIAGLKLVELINSLAPKKARLYYLPMSIKNAKDPSDLKYVHGTTQFKKFLNETL